MSDPDSVHSNMMSQVRSSGPPVAVEPRLGAPNTVDGISSVAGELRLGVPEPVDDSFSPVADELRLSAPDLAEGAFC